MGSFNGFIQRVTREAAATMETYRWPTKPKVFSVSSFTKKKKFADPWEVFSKWDVILGE